MFWNNKKQEKQDEETAQTLIDFAETLNSSKQAFQILRRYLFLNIFIWAIVLIFPNLMVILFGILGSGKISIFFLGIPFGASLFLAYTFFRIKFPDVEANKTLDSDLMSSMNYQSSANKRFYVWTASILTGIFNTILFIVFAYILNQYGLYLFSF